MYIWIYTHAYIYVHEHTHLYMVLNLFFLTQDNKLAVRSRQEESRKREKLIKEPEGKKKLNFSIKTIHNTHAHEISFRWSEVQL